MDMKKLFEEALLAQVAYIDNLKTGMKDNELVAALLSDEDNNITQAQAEYFASNFIVVQQVNESGFSATLFKNIDSQEYHLANRGTDSFFDGDWTDANASNSDYGMAYNQVAELINFYLQVTHSKLVSSSANLQHLAFEALQSKQQLAIREAA